MHKIGFEILEVESIKDKSVKVVVASTGKPLWLPIKHAERFGNMVYIPTWLFIKIFGKVKNENFCDAR